jgi:hypothetical protein
MKDWVPEQSDEKEQKLENLPFDITIKKGSNGKLEIKVPSLKTAIEDSTKTGIDILMKQMYTNNKEPTDQLVKKVTKDSIIEELTNKGETDREYDNDLSELLEEYKGNE